MMLEALALPASACIFLDDLGVNLKPAQAMGMTTIKVPFGDVAAAIAELEALIEIPLRGLPPQD
jgi:putative hydrolase of the HAD superfamily